MGHDSPAPKSPAAAQESAGLGTLRRRFPGLTELALFCLVGASGLAVDYLVFVPLVHFDLADARLAAIPAFLVGLLLIYVFAFRLRIFPLGGGGD